MLLLEILGTELLGASGQQVYPVLVHNRSGYSGGTSAVGVALNAGGERPNSGVTTTFEYHRGRPSNTNYLLFLTLTLFL
jgi:hypothetical protein